MALSFKRINHDIWYIENWSLWLDIQIVGLTVWNMIKGDKNAY
ncbi:MAG: sugar transferase [Ignavibacteriaceae bacterium]